MSYDPNAISELIKYGKWMEADLKGLEQSPLERKLLAALPDLLALQAALDKPVARGTQCEYNDTQPFPKNECEQYHQGNGNCWYTDKPCTAQRVLIIEDITADMEVRGDGR